MLAGYAKTTPAFSVKRPLVSVCVCVYVCVCVCVCVSPRWGEQCQGTNQSDEGIQAAGKGTKASSNLNHRAGRQNEHKAKLPISTCFLLASLRSSNSYCTLVFRLRFSYFNFFCSPLITSSAEIISRHVSKEESDQSCDVKFPYLTVFNILHTLGSIKKALKFDIYPYLSPMINLLLLYNNLIQMWHLLCYFSLKVNV